MSEDHSKIYEQHAQTLTDTERALLADQEPGIEFRIIGADEAGLSQGRQSRVSVLEYERDGKTFRVLWKRMGAGKDLDEPETRAMQAELSPYRSELVAAGWRVPKLLHSRVTQVEGESQVFSYDQYIAGRDGEKMLRNSAEPNFRKWHLMNEVVRTLAGYPADTLRRETIAGKVLTTLPHGLDLKLANVVLEPGTDDLYFVDLFGPKRLDEHGNWRAYTTKLDSLAPDRLRAVTATREGAILRCWRLAEQHWFNGYQSVEDLRTDFLAQLAQSALPAEELTLIQAEVQGNYPWLDEIYNEQQI